MDKKNQISIIMPVYNTKSYLEDSVDSVLQQTYDNWELIIVDDGSEDGSSVLLDNLAKRHGDYRLKVFHEKNHGLSAARNFGISKAKGEFVIFLDSDDMFEDNLLKSINQSINRFSVDLVMFPYQRIDDNGNVLPMVVDKKIYTQNDKLFSGDYLLKLLLTEKIKNYAWQFAIRLKVIQENEIKFPEGLLFEDIATTYKFFQKSQTISFIDDECYLYRQSSSSIVNRKLSSKSIHDYTYASQCIYEDLIKANNPLIEGYYLHRVYENYRRIARRNLQHEFPDELKMLEKEINKYFSLQNIKTFSLKQKIGLLVIVIKF
ncbi:glycosyltransferase family 2 protein [Leuconostoc gelidum subsp. gelidum]|uniref:glycosyltransferase family 2 protein n=1 Tax=Leuconostoc gelidum TaxID=1244 RepID=UPI001CC66DE1|nr:glycosyltransferase family 2 protein [Leuconostoc gelidum]MBZ6014020.1 glycosyltransferase family 2 protein [Leuconostoc gelidum subsp. gelidum]